MDSNGTIIAVVVASTALFFGVIGWKLVWFLRKAGEQPRDTPGNATAERTTRECATVVSDADDSGNA
ncbi:MAG: hypothetical protein V2I24_04830 [Halieaceae bacterium]|jgi:hypothetical protein|nr:hypothetical protein [Halieaceae bacterium]